MISSLSFSTIAHATEDLEKVKTAMLNLIPKDLRTSITVNQSTAKGHHGNPITLLNFEINDPKSAKAVFAYIIRSLSDAEVSQIRNQLNLYYDGRSALFLRIDKQSAYLGTLHLSLSDDVIKLRVNLVRGNLPSISEILSKQGY
ncbi:MAG: RNA-binding domain-containing protein [Candidatus Methanomethylicaceae archaeon]|nr:RNA-binding domain-containing protein [Candidatus Verstraetearchaeota archaeon]